MKAKFDRSISVSAPLHSRGMTLLDVLLAIVIFAVGMLALTSLQGNLSRSSADANARTAAVNIAEELIEEMRTFEQTQSETGVVAYQDIVSTTDTETRSNIVYNIGVTVEDLQHKLDDLLKTSPKAGIYGGGGVGQVFITPRVKRVLDLANDEANHLKDDYISTEHIFLAIASERNTPVARLLADTGVTLDIVDSGTGIPKENLDRIFEPFFSTKAPGEGTGLGLFVSRDIVEKFGGKLAVESKLGEGTCFRIQIPDQDRYSNDDLGLK